MLILIQGPAGGGKSARYRELIESGAVVAIADFTALWAAIGQHSRDPETGLYPVRTSEDPLVRTGLIAYVQATVVRQALRTGSSVAITTSQADQEARWREIAVQEGAEFRAETIDPGRQVVTERLAAQSPTGELQPECAQAINRWYRR